MEALTQQQQADHDDLASAVGAAVSAHQLDLDALRAADAAHSFEHDLKAPDFGSGDVHGDLEVDVSALNIPQMPSGDEDDVGRDFDIPQDTYDKWSKPLTMRKGESW